MALSQSGENDAKRFYVGNLFHNVNEQDLQKLFVKYGSVTNVEIKSKQDIDGNKIATYAFITINLKDKHDNAASQCIRDCNNLKWKKNVIKVQVAQESFLSRLQKERQSSKDTTVKNINTEQNENKTIAKNVDSDLKVNKSVNINDRRDETYSNLNIKKIDAGKKQNGTIDFPSDDEEQSLGENIGRRNNKQQMNSRKVYHSSSDEETETLTSKKPEKSIQFNDKKQYNNRIEIPNEKIEFNAFKEENQQVKLPIVRSSESSTSKSVPQRRQYYSSSSDEEEESSSPRKKLKISPTGKLESKKSPRSTSNFLTKLESFDSFWQDEPKEAKHFSSEYESNEKANFEEPINIDSASDEANKPLPANKELDQGPVDTKRKGKAILDEIKNKKHDDNTSSSLSNNMLRFDPSDETHKKYDLENSSTRQLKSDNSSEEKKDEVRNDEEEQDKNFWMSSTFASDLTAKMKQENTNEAKRIAATKSSFSFNFDSATSSIGNSYDGEKLNNDKTEFTNATKPKPRILQDDSSDDESSNMASSNNTEEDSKIAQTIKHKYTNLNSSEKFGLKLKEKAVFASVVNPADGKSLSTKLETFFFLPNDRRLEEGLSFIRETESMDELRKKFEEKRPILAEILRKKMRNKVKKQEKNSFGGSLRRLKNKRNGFKKKFKRNIKK